MFLKKILKDDRGGQVFLRVLLIVSILVPFLNLVVPEGSVLHISTYTVTLLGKYLTYALLAIAVDLVWGILGILSLGHGAFFCPRWLCNGYVFDASDWRPRCLW
jgi:urea transport system permease protein